MAATVAPRGLGPQDPTKNLAHWVDLLGQLLSRKNVFEIFGSEPPLPPLKCGMSVCGILEMLMSIINGAYIHLHHSLIVLGIKILYLNNKG